MLVFPSVDDPMVLSPQTTSVVMVMTRGRVTDNTDLSSQNKKNLLLFDPYIIQYNFFYHVKNNKCNTN